MNVEIGYEIINHYEGKVRFSTIHRYKLPLTDFCRYDV